MIEEAVRVLKIEAQAILDLSQRLNGSFDKCVDMILGCKGKLIVAGIGKSGHIGRKISSTFSSTGTSSVFVHPAESIHGDLGMIAKGDVVLGISYGGESREFELILQYLARKGIPLIAMTGKLDSTLAKAADLVLDVGVAEEACPLGLAPTASSTATLALGDALAMAVLRKRGLNAKDFAEFHPGGSLGRKLLTRVKDVMHVGEALPLVNPETPLLEVLSIMTAKEVRGVVGVVNSGENLVGIITDGDVRRWFKKSQNVNVQALEIMSKTPKTIDVNELAEKALFILEKHKIMLLFAVDKTAENPNKPQGLVHLHDLLEAKIR